MTTSISFKALKNANGGVNLEVKTLALLSYRMKNNFLTLSVG